ncbi:triacylglycerol lipase [Penicillium macrosclerotiorum]|uniref:triacylglycerol lipase n=1 Tax=Penicillium macrosclerotiorum TaxID=303699 RepID=UPI0025480974|nr:triacylglycerol lipase [Penicillium macrosclerotiorum]KAJ5683279.1 triacylglycerol lipase [Penicillium macrosclerotiorum]
MSTSTLPSPIDPRFLSRLDDDFIDYYNKYLAIKPATHNITIKDIRATPQKFASPWYRDFTYEPFVKDLHIESEDGHVFTARCYQPDHRTSPFGKGPYPVHINFHGGGFVLGDLTGDAELCMQVRNKVGIIVIDVDYRLSPENTFGKGHDDAWAAIRWVHEHGAELNGQPASISIGGISAGGHISAVCQQLARDASINLQLAILAVPSTAGSDTKTASDTLYPSYLENEFAPCLNLMRLKFFKSLYMPKTDAELAEIEARPVFFRSPIQGDLRGVCKTYIATAECDPLRDEGEAYARCLLEAGVQVTVRRYTGVPHPFMHMLLIKKAQLYVEDICAQLRMAHGA